MPKIVDASKKVAAIQLSLNASPAPVEAAQRWLGETTHREGCQCHKCHWAHGVVSGRIKVTFEEWRKG